MIIVLDSNVLVSGLPRPHSKPATIVRLVATGALRVAYDERMLVEYREVLARIKFPFSPEQIRNLLDQIEAEGEAVTALPLSLSLPDPDDLPFPEVAVTAHADAPVTGNKTRHYPARARHGMRRNSTPCWMS